MRKIYLTLVFCFFSISAFSESKNNECAKKNLVNVDVNGMVCDFCARALEKVFSKKKEVTAIDVDLDNGKISITFNDGASLDDSLIKKLVTNSGYDVVKIYRCEFG
jgi:copper chaperone CopZ